MKMAIFFTLLIFSKITAAASTCDLNITVSPFEGGTLHSVKFKGYQKYYSDGSNDKFWDLAINDALTKCKNAGATNCSIINKTADKSSFTYDLKGAIAIAEGTILKDAKQLTEKEIAKKRQKLICQRLNECIAAAINDESSTPNYMQKLIMAKDNSACSNLENFLFTN